MTKHPVLNIQLFDVEHHVFLQVLTGEVIATIVLAIREAQRRLDDKK